ncbi:MAG: hypothetical protein M3R47_18510 [Chloroflexota bacterium]|nr:hypothetical protein [Chloroflexota bacterium]
MTTKQVRDWCGLYCVAEFANYEHAEFFMYLIGTGVTRSLYELTAHDRKTRMLLFDMQVEVSAPALEARALKTGTNTDGQAVTIALGYARRIIETKAYERGKRFRLQVEAETESLHQAPWSSPPRHAIRFFERKRLMKVMLL